MKNRAAMREWRALQKRRARLIETADGGALRKKAAPLLKGMEERAPKKALCALQKAFEKGLELGLGPGGEWIGQSFNEQKRASSARAGLPGENPRRGELRRLRWAAGRETLGNRMLGAVEGGALGALGIGLPDIPLLIGLLLKTAAEVRTRYGFSGQGEAERVFLLQTLCCAFAGRKEAEGFFAQAEQTGLLIDSGRAGQVAAGDWAASAAGLMAARLTAEKALQGVLLVGAVGGACNWAAVWRVGEAARVTYGGRFLRKYL